LCDELIKQGDVVAISATVLTSNTASIKTMEKLGLQFVKIIHIQINQGELPAVLYSKSA
jgi:RimJ/RimL family protein N-acetyltransferase